MNRKLRSETTIYLAGGLFNVGERRRNAQLAKFLRRLGYTVILPQERAIEFFDGKKFNIRAIVADCVEQCSNPNTIFVGCLDGPETDSGVAVEYGVAIALIGQAILFRTDFRTNLKHEVGINAMFGAGNTELIYFPCFAIKDEEFDFYYRKLVERIDRRVGLLLCA